MAYISQLLRTHVRTRAKFHCEYCKRPERLVGQKFEVDHIKPESKGGKTESDNLELSCRMCNSYKSDAESGVDPETEETVSLFNPRIQQWSQHFMWSDTYELTGKTNVGRATLVQMRLNEPPIVEARQFWADGGWIPSTD